MNAEPPSVIPDPATAERIDAAIRASSVPTRSTTAGFSLPPNHTGTPSG